MDKKMLEALKSFEPVWRRVEQSKGFGGGAQLMPAKRQPKTSATRFSPLGSRHTP